VSTGEIRCAECGAFITYWHFSSRCLSLPPRYPWFCSKECQEASENEVAWNEKNVFTIVTPSNPLFGKIKYD
jgi:hypothetical protein